MTFWEPSLPEWKFALVSSKEKQSEVNRHTLSFCPQSNCQSQNIFHKNLPEVSLESSQLDTRTGNLKGPGLLRKRTIQTPRVQSYQPVPSYHPHTAPRIFVFLSFFRAFPCPSLPPWTSWTKLVEHLTFTVVNEPGLHTYKCVHFMPIRIHL